MSVCTALMALVCIWSGILANRPEYGIQNDGKRTFVVLFFIWPVLSVSLYHIDHILT